MTNELFEQIIQEYTYRLSKTPFTDKYKKRILRHNRSSTRPRTTLAKLSHKIKKKRQDKLMMQRLINKYY